ncbi:MAG TPA: chemotaxis-specific protein-glutamate methyltransferase CheB [Longimicrobiales bacterium]
MTLSSEALKKSRVLVVEDSELMRNVLVDIITDSTDFRVVGQAATGYEAIRLVHELNPDIVTLDLQMPDLGGLGTLGYIMSETPRPVVVVSSYVSDKAAGPALQALEFGAVDVVAKPSGDQRRDVDTLGDRLLDALRAASEARVANLRMTDQSVRTVPTHSQAQPTSARSAFAIAASTGGPRALTEIIPSLPIGLPSAVLIVQHMPSGFTKPFAERLATLSAVPVHEAVDGQLLEAGSVYLAPGGKHMALRRTAEGIAIALDDGDALWGVKPAADVLFRSVAAHFGPASGGIVLTGMGRDGAEGLRAIREVGGWTAVQDPASSVVYGMPKFAAPHADEQLSLETIAKTIAATSLSISRKRRR